MNYKRYVILLALLFGLFITGVAQTGIPRAQAMFIYNFSRLIEWPANYRSGDFVIGVLGSSPTESELNTYTNGKKVGAQSITVQNFNSPSEVGTCHILFVPFSKTKQLAELSSLLQGKSTLVITEKNGAIDEGAALNFVIVGNKLKFELKTDNASKYGIKFSSKLLEMAYKTY